MTDDEPDYMKDDPMVEAYLASKAADELTDEQKKALIAKIQADAAATDAMVRNRTIG